jgi:hypothetical protein
LVISGFATGGSAVPFIPWAYGRWDIAGANITGSAFA